MDRHKDISIYFRHALWRIDLLLHRQVLRFRAEQRRDMDQFSGLYITEEEIDSLLRPNRDAVLTAEEASHEVGAKPEPDISPAASLTASGTASVAASVAEIDKQLARASEHVLADHGDHRLPALGALFGLSPFELDTILICLAPELDLRYQKLYAYLQDDVTKKRPSVALVLQLLCDSFSEELAARAYFAPHGPLRRYRLVRLFDDPAHPHPPLLSKFLKIDDRIVNYILGIDGPDGLDEAVSEYANLIRPALDVTDALLPDGVKERLVYLARASQEEPHGHIFYLQGPYGVGKRATARMLSSQLDTSLLLIDGASLHGIDAGIDAGIGAGIGAARSGVERPAELLGLIMREARLQGAIVYWDGFDRLLDEGHKVWRDLLLTHLSDWPGVTMFAGNTTWEPSDALHNTPFTRIELHSPDFGDRLRLWQASFDRDTAANLGDALQVIASKFQLTGGQIRDAAATARNLARWRDPYAAQVSERDLHAACRLHSNRKLATLAQRVSCRYQWHELVLPGDRQQQLRDICNWLKHRALVYGEWGFARKLSLGKGLNALFAGPSGTGKTMAAEIIAGELALELYKIDLSSVVSKYIGETEKNLARIFAEAETSNAILFFDEADALFGKRSEVRDAHDRYANIEISYLLQRMEEYEGVVILATNLRKNMDDAFVRRMHITVEFPFPNASDRERIWRGVWPAQTPRSDELDLDFMAQRFELAGGNIRNIALAAAFLAAEDGTALTMEHLMRATRREYQKMGKVIGEREFGAYSRAHLRKRTA